MANTPTREHREAAIRAWKTIGSGDTVWAIAKEICDAEQRGRDAELAEVVDWLSHPSMSGQWVLCWAVTKLLQSGKHRAKGGK